MFIILICLRYNANAHPIPFHKAQDLGKAPKKIAAEPAPDLEEAYNVRFYRSNCARSLIHSQLGEDIPDAASDDDRSKKKSLDDFSTDKLIKRKGKGKGKPNARRWVTRTYILVVHTKIGEVYIIESLASQVFWCNSAGLGVESRRASPSRTKSESIFCARFRSNLKFSE